MRSVTRCPASGEPTLTCWSARLIRPVALTVRSTSITAPVAGGQRRGPAGRAPLAAQPGQVSVPSRDGRVLIRAPSSSTCRLVASAQRVTCRPDRAGPSQTCCPPIHKFPDGGTTRSTSTAGRPAPAGCPALALPPRAGSVRAADRALVAGGFGWPVLAVSWAGMRSSSGETAGVNRLAGKAMSSDWCGRSVLYSCRQASSAACSASMLGERPVHVEQLALQGLVQPLDLAGRGRRAGLGQPVGDAVLPADPVEQHLRRTPGLWNRPVNTLPLSVSTSSGIP